MQQATPSVPRVAQPHAVSRGITWRACGLGIFLTLLVALLPPYSDNIVHNTYLVGNHLPLIMVAVITLLCVVINPLLGTRRLTTTEMIVGVGMMMIACALPSSGFLRYFHSLLTSTVYFAKDTPWYGKYLAYLPDWAVPSKDPNASIVQDFQLGMDPRRGARLGATWGPWLPVYVGWGLFIVPMFSAVVLVCPLLRKQWVVHERLAFPLASIPLEMLAAPEHGGRWNALWRSRLLWIGVLLPLGIHLLNGAAKFWPNLPSIPLEYKLDTALSEYPWKDLNGYIKTSQVFFSVIGVTFFVPLEISFSLWFFFFGGAIVEMFLSTRGIPVTYEHHTYQGLGMFLAYGVMILWIARHHLLHVARSLWKAREPEEYLPYGLNVGLLAGCMMMASGTLANGYGSLLNPGNWGLGLLVVTLILFYGMVLTRLVIDAGVLMIQVPAGAEVMRCLGFLFYGNPALLSARQWVLSGFASQMMLTDQREALMPFAADALRLGGNIPARSRVRYFVMVVVALFGCLVVSGVTHHAISYMYGRQDFDDGHGPVRFPKLAWDLARENVEPGMVPAKINRPLHVAYGAAAVTVVGVARLLFVDSPLHPIGLLMNNNWAIGRIWFSIFLCWAVKVIILRWGGAGVYQKSRWFFIGLLVGESLAGVFWGVVGFVAPWPDWANAYQVMPH